MKKYENIFGTTGNRTLLAVGNFDVRIGTYIRSSAIYYEGAFSPDTARFIGNSNKVSVILHHQ